MTARIVAPLRPTNGVVNAGATNFTKSLATHLGSDNITVNCIHPGMTVTDRMRGNFERRAKDAGVSFDEIAAQTIAEIPMGRLIDPAISQTRYCFLLPDGGHRDRPSHRRRRRVGNRRELLIFALINCRITPSYGKPQRGR